MRRKHRKQQELQESNSGIGAVEVILILVILIGIVLIFKLQIRELAAILFDKVLSGSVTVLFE